MFKKVKNGGDLLISAWKKFVDDGTITFGPELKLCRNCKWCKPTNWFMSIIMQSRLEFALCGSPQNTIVNPITGGKTLKWKFCSVHRNHKAFGEHVCGSEGRFFVPKDEK